MGGTGKLAGENLLAWPGLWGAGQGHAACRRPGRVCRGKPIQVVAGSRGGTEGFSRAGHTGVRLDSRRSCLPLQGNGIEGQSGYLGPGPAAASRLDV